MSERSVFTVSIIGVVVGLVVLLAGASELGNGVVVAGGLVALASVGLLTYRLSQMEDVEGAGHGHGH